MNKTIDAAMFSKMLCGAASSLESKKEAINRLNVFPVPDGDTGSNMYLTLSPVRSLPVTKDSLSVYSEAAAKSIMRSARGNSGVILSLFFRGMAGAFADTDKADSEKLVDAIKCGYESAKKAVMNPVEGTILTVMRECAVFRDDEIPESIEDTLASVSLKASEALKKTPEMLPVLKRAKTVDSGGCGFTAVINGMLNALNNTAGNPADTYYSIPESGFSSQDTFDSVEIKFSFCTECLIGKGSDIDSYNTDELRAFLEGIGDSIVLAEDNEIIKVHIHTNDPLTVITRMMKFGELQFIKVENMRQQHNALVLKEADETSELKPATSLSSVIAVAGGSGFRDLFMELGAEYVISAGQSMNPGIGDYLKGINEVESNTVFILPNNPNAIPAARQAAELSEAKEVHVLETSTLPQGISALISFDGTASAKENLESMSSAAGSVKTLSVTRASKSINLGDLRIKRKQYLGLVENDLKYASDTLEECIKSMVREISEKEIITLFCGKGVKDEESRHIEQLLSELLPNCQDLSVVLGNQPVYRFIISAE